MVRIARVRPCGRRMRQYVPVAPNREGRCRIIRKSPSFTILALILTQLRTDISTDFLADDADLPVLNRGEEYQVVPQERPPNMTGDYEFD